VYALSVAISAAQGAHSEELPSSCLAIRRYREESRMPQTRQPL
jgi:hypothetical protein